MREIGRKSKFALKKEIVDITCIITIYFNLSSTRKIYNSSQVLKSCRSNYPVIKVSYVLVIALYPEIHFPD